MLFLKMPCKRTQEVHIIGLEVLLEGISYVPAGLSTAVQCSLRIAEGESVLFRHGHHLRAVSFRAGLIAVKQDHKRCVGLEVLRQIQPVFPFHASMLDRMSLRLLCLGSADKK